MYDPIMKKSIGVQVVAKVESPTVVEKELVSMFMKDIEVTWIAECKVSLGICGLLKPTDICTRYCRLSWNSIGWSASIRDDEVLLRINASSAYIKHSPDLPPWQYARFSVQFLRIRAIIPGKVHAFFSARLRTPVHWKYFNKQCTFFT